MYAIGAARENPPATMPAQLGKRLSSARLERGLTLDEVAHATKLRPDKILALESDDYSRFANNAYAKGFLQIYGRFLEVDVSELTRALDSSNPISVTDYQYLSNAPAPRVEERPALPRFHRRGAPSLIPLLGVVVALIVLGVGFQTYVNWQRVERKGTTPQGGATRGSPASTAAPERGVAPETAAPTREIVPAPASTVAATPATRALLHSVAAAGESDGARSPAPAESAPAAPALNGPPAAPVSPGAVASSDRDFLESRPAGTTALNEVLVQPIRKTWITVRRDDPRSAPVFEDFLYPDAAPLKLKGAKFFIEARDPAAIQIRKNGAPIAYQAPGVAVQ